MELFSITCTTCKSRLKVRDQAAVGQILACPKCGGMVMIKPPPVWSESSEQKSDLPTATELVGAVVPFDQTLDSSAFDVVDELLSDSPPKMQPPPSFTPAPNVTPVPAASGPPKPRFVGGPAAHRSPPPPAHKTPPPPTTAQAKTTPPGRSGAAAAPNVTPDAEPLPPPAETAAEHAETLAAPRTARRYWLLMAGSVGLGVLLALAAVMVAIRFVEPAGSAAKKAAITAAEPAPPKNSHADPPPTAQPVVQSPIESPLATPAPPQSVSVTPAVESTASSPPALSPAIDPLGLVSDSPPSPAAVKAPPSNDPLAKFDRLIGGAADDPLAKAAASPKPAVAASPDSTPARPIAPRPPAREIDVAKRLADPLPRIQTAGTPLAVFLQLLSDLSTIPITLEPDALPLVKATAESPVILDVANTTVGGALTQALVRLSLEWIEIDGELIVRVAEPTELKTYGYPTRNLAADSEAMAELADTLRALVEPGSWGDQPGQGEIQIDAAKGVLAIRQRKAVHAILVFLCDKIRAARGKPPASSGFDSSAFALDSRTSKARPRLETPVSLTYSQPTRLITILQRLEEAAGVRILVDWRDLAAAGWNPAAEASLVASKQPLAAALDALLDPLDLTWRVVDGRTLQVVTPARFAEQCESELYKVGDLIAGDSSGEGMIARIRAALGEATFRAGGGSGEIRYDDEGKCLVAWLPQPKQRELESLVGKWRSENGK